MESFFTVTVYVSQGTDLKADDPYIRVECGGSQRETKRGTKEKVNIFNNRLEFVFDASKAPPQSLSLHLVEFSRFFKSKVIGSASLQLPASGFVKEVAVTDVPAPVIPCHFAALSNTAGSVQVSVTVKYTGAVTDAQRLRYKQALGLMTLRITSVLLPAGGSLFASSVYFVEVCHGLLKYSTRPQHKVAGEGSSGASITFNEDVRFWVYDDTKDYEVQITLFEKQHLGEPKQISTAFLSTQELIGGSVNEGSDEEIALELPDRSRVGVTDRDSRFLTSEGQPTSPVVAGTAASQSRREVRLKPVYKSKSEVESAFLDGLWTHFDSDGNGTLSQIEVASMMDTIKCPMSDQQLITFMKTVDEDYDGELTREELTRFFNSAEFQNNPMSSNMLSYLLDGKDGLDHMVSGISDRLTMKPGAGGSSVAAVSTGNGHDEDDMGLIVFERSTGMLLHENIPSYIKIALKSMYRTGFGQKLTETSKIRSMLVQQSRAEGVKMNHPDSRAKIAPFIELHGLDMSEIKLSLEQFPHFNAFFYRELKEGSRPIAAPADSRVAVSCADSRMTVFPDILDATVVWIKGSEFTVEKLLGPRKDLASEFLGATLVIARLAPQDYHRFHFPVSGTVKSITEIEGTLYTVNPIAVRQPVNVYTENIRHIMELETKEFGKVVMIPVGATLVGSVNVLPQYKKAGAAFEKGADAGYFAFGGSTVLTLFRQGTIDLDDDLVESSKKPVEVLVRVGMQIGVATGKS